MHHSLPLIFDSGRLPSEQRLPFAREEFGRKVLQVELECVDEQPFDYRLSGDIFCSTHIAAITCSGVQHVRNRRIASHNSNLISWVLPLRGRIAAGHAGDYQAMAPGHIMMLNCDREGMVACPSGGTFLTIITSRAHGGGIGPDDLAGKRLVYGSRGIALLQAYLRFLGTSSLAATEAGRAVAERQIMELLALGLNAETESSGEGAAVARLAAIHAEIEAHFHEPWFGINDCAAALGLSVRYVQALCQRNGSSFSGEVRRRRLEKAFRLLRDPASRNTPVTAIALDCGYSDISHFNRLFRSAYGDSPSGVRSSAAGG